MERRNLLKAFIALGACPVCARSASAAGAHWGYEGHEGPAHWGELSKDYVACSSGTQQSPIDIAGAVRAEIPDLAIEWREGGGAIINTGYSIQINVPEGSTLTRGEKVHKLLQFHFHAPSEHQMDGRAFPVEAHFVHRDTESDALAVIAVFLTPGGANPGFSKLASAFPTTAGEETSLDKVDPEGLLPTSLGYWTYAGSLTTPPCTENVEWLLAMEPVEVDDADIKRLTKLYPMNTRPVQSLDRRVILALP